MPIFGGETRGSIPATTWLKIGGRDQLTCEENISLNGKRLPYIAFDYSTIILAVDRVELNFDEEK